MDRCKRLQAAELDGFEHHASAQPSRSHCQKAWVRMVGRLTHRNTSSGFACRMSLPMRPVGGPQHVRAALRIQHARGKWPLDLVGVLRP